VCLILHLLLLKVSINHELVLAKTFHMKVAMAKSPPRDAESEETEPPGTESAVQQDSSHDTCDSNAVLAEETSKGIMIQRCAQ